MLLKIETCSETILLREQKLSINHVDRCSYGGDISPFEVLY